MIEIECGKMADPDIMDTRSAGTDPLVHTHGVDIVKNPPNLAILGDCPEDDEVFVNISPQGIPGSAYEGVTGGKAFRNIILKAPKFTCNRFQTPECPLNRTEG